MGTGKNGSQRNDDKEDEMFRKKEEDEREDGRKVVLGDRLQREKGCHGRRVFNEADDL